MDSEGARVARELEEAVIIRSGYSFRAAAGKIEDVLSRIAEIGWSVAPICDRYSTFAFNRWAQACKDKELRPIYGVELGVTKSLGEKKPAIDHWRFFATDSMRQLNDAVYTATANPGRLLLYDQAASAPGLMKVSGSHLLIDCVELRDDFFVSLSPSTPKALYKEAKRRGHKFCATSDNLYPRQDDSDMYHVVMGKRSQDQTYPLHILSDAELRLACHYASDEDFADAVSNREMIFSRSHAKLSKATMIKPHREKPLLEMCQDGAASKGVNLDDPVYSERLHRELTLIQEKNFEDYFYVVADLLQWAKKEMVCGPGRGSSSGSLVCFLLDITAVDPIKFDLVFERFIDVTRADYPDIDVDISDKRRERAFKYLEDKYGTERVARLGTVALFQARSCLNQAGMALGVPKFLIEGATNSIIIRSKGDSRADYSVMDSFEVTEAGRKLIANFPQMAIAGRIETHPQFRGQHAAGVVMTQSPVREYVAVDATNSTAMCDWQDAKDLDLLKVDVLGLTQLSIFEQTLRLIGEKDTNGFLENVSLEDQAALDVLNKRHLAGVFQFQGDTTKQVVHELDRVTSFDDIVNITALCRPGPLASGGTKNWINRKNGTEKVEAIHPAFAPYLDPTLGVTIYQEQVMRICRDIGGMSWGDVTALRKAMGKSLGVEYFDGYRDKFIPNALAKGIPEDVVTRMWNDLCRFGTYGFNKAHSVAYGFITYYCCWFKAHHPVEFAAATLDSEDDQMKQVAILRELKEEGVDYVAVDAELSTDRWSVAEKKGKKTLIGPLSMVKGIGPVYVQKILQARRSGERLKGKLPEKLINPVTPIDSLFPVRDSVQRLWPDLADVGIVTRPTLIKDASIVGGEVLVIGVLTKNHPLNENEPARVAKRGHALPANEPVNAINFHLRDDTDDIFCKLSRWNYGRLSETLLRGRNGKSLFAVKGNIPPDFRMIWVNNIRYLGEIDDDSVLDLLASSASSGNRSALPQADAAE